MFQGIIYSAEGFGIKDSLTKNLVSLVIIALFSIAVLKYGGGSRGAILVALGIQFAFTLFFTIISWLNPVFLFGEVIVLIIGIFIMLTKGRE